MAIAEEFMLGNTRIVIMDDYCVKTQEEIDAILARIARNAQRAFEAEAMRKAREARETASS